MPAISSKPTTFWPNFSVRESPVHPESPARCPGEAGVVGAASRKSATTLRRRAGTIVAKLRNGADDERQQYAARGVDRERPQALPAGDGGMMLAPAPKLARPEPMTSDV